MAHIYWLETLRHRNGCRVSMQEQLDEVERRYLLNEHAKVVLGLGPEFYESTHVDVPTDEDKL